MAAYNYVVFDETCPACGIRATLRAQTHIASDYEGDKTGRFMENEHKLGERMRWFARDSQDYDTWATWGWLLGTEEVREVCPANCMACGAKLYAVLEFVDVAPVRVREVGMESDWDRATTKWA